MVHPKKLFALTLFQTCVNYFILGLNDAHVTLNFHCTLANVLAKINKSNNNNATVCNLQHLFSLSSLMQSHCPLFKVKTINKLHIQFNIIN